jgi:L-lactate dehydrogenase complex protein LldE
VSADRVVLLPTCVVDTVAGEVGDAVVRVLRRFGCEVTVPGDATCCGQPAWNAGFAGEAAQVARTTLSALEQALAEAEAADAPDGARADGSPPVVCVPAGSCAAMIRVFWPELFHLAGDEEGVERARRVGARTREFSELLHERSGGGVAGAFAADVAYHHSCHMLRELRISEPPEALLGALEGCRSLGWSAAERCCGFGGLFSVKLPETSVAMADDKLDALDEAGASHLVGSDQSCLLHLQGRLRRRGGTMPVRHLAQVLDEAGAHPIAEASAGNGDRPPAPRGTS